MEAEFTRRLQSAMKAQGRTQAELAAATNVSQSQVSKWIRGRNVPDVFQAQALAKFLGVSVDWLAGDESNSHAESSGLDTDEMSETTEIHKKIQRLMDERGWSQVRLAQKLSVTPQRVSLWLKGTGTPRPHQLLKMAEVFNVDVRYLLSDEEEEPVRPCQAGKDEPLSDDERAILVVFRTLRLTRDEAMSGLALMQLKRHTPDLASIAGLKLEPDDDEPFVN